MTKLRTTNGACPFAIRLLCLVPVLALTACLDDSDDSSTSEPPPPPSSEEVPPLATPAISVDDGPTIGTDHWANGNTSSGGQGQSVDGLDCVPTAPVAYHVHTHLAIFLNGEQLTVPAEVGMVPGAGSACHYLLHTHDASGLIHLHAEEPTDFTLGQFFAIWGQPLEPANVAGLMDMPVTIYVTDEDDATASVYEGDYEAIELISHRLITIQVGTPLEEIPTYAWSFD